MEQPLFGGNAVFLAIAAFIILCIFLGVRIVPQSEKFVVERFGRLRAVLGPGINFIVPFLDRVPHKISILERQLPNASQDAITADVAAAGSIDVVIIDLSIGEVDGGQPRQTVNRAGIAGDDGAGGVGWFGW